MDVIHLGVIHLRSLSVSVRGIGFNISMRKNANWDAENACLYTPGESALNIMPTYLENTIVCVRHQKAELEFKIFIVTS